MDRTQAQPEEQQVLAGPEAAPDAELGANSWRKDRLGISRPQMSAGRAHRQNGVTRTRFKLSSETIKTLHRVS